VCCATIQTVLTSTFRYGTEVTELVQVVGKGNLKIQVFGGLALYRWTDQRRTHYMDNTHPATLSHPSGLELSAMLIWEPQISQHALSLVDE